MSCDVGQRGISIGWRLGIYSKSDGVLPGNLRLQDPIRLLTLADINHWLKGDCKDDIEARPTPQQIVQLLFAPVAMPLLFQARLRWHPTVVSGPL